MVWYDDHNKRYVTKGNKVRASIPCREYDDEECKGRMVVIGIDRTFVSGDGYYWQCKKCDRRERTIL